MTTLGDLRGPERRSSGFFGFQVRWGWPEEMETPNEGIVSSVVTQHSEEAAFLWVLRNATVDQPHYSLPDLAALDNRVEAHLDGLRVAGEPGWEICAGPLSVGETGHVFAAAILGLESGSKGLVVRHSSG